MCDPAELGGLPAYDFAFAAEQRLVVAVGEGEARVGVAIHVQESAVDEVVTSGAEPDQQVEVGPAATGPPDRVMDLHVGVLAAGGGTHAPLVADDCTALLHGGDAVGSADVRILDWEKSGFLRVRIGVMSAPHDKNARSWGPMGS